MQTVSPIRRALVSVSDKSGVVDFCRQLADLGIEILSTGGTAKLLEKNNISVTEVSSYTEFPEMMDGRIKTLHPKVHGGILARRGQDDAVMAEHGIKAIDLLVVNLYPFEATINQAQCTLEQAVENIDIGGPTMLRAAAKNHQDVTVVVDHNDYTPLIEVLAKTQGTPYDLRFHLATKAFSHTAHYDTMIAGYLAKQTAQEARLPETLTLNAQLKQALRYGENPHQQAAFYQIPGEEGVASVANAIQHQGKALSYNNIADTDAALECVKSFTGQAACVIVKHANPCGVAVADSLLHAYEAAFQTDPTSAFGGIIAFNQILEGDTAAKILANQFVEVIIAPSYTEAALTALAEKSNIRVLACGPIESGANATQEVKQVTGGFLIQDKDQKTTTIDDLKVVTQRQPTQKELDDLLFCWKVAKHVKSNAIVYAKNHQTIGIGAGQMSRVYSAKIAGIKAADENLTVEGSVMASDAFFPFRDGIDTAAQNGITAVVQPGGSIRDEEVIAAANEHNMAMVFTGTRHFKH